MKKKAGPKLNVRLLRKVQKHILAEPKRLKMRQWVDRKNTDRPVDMVPPCGTTACIAGWALLISGTRTRGGDGTMDKAADLLGLTRIGAYRLFLLSDWPARFSKRYNRQIEGYSLNEQASDSSLRHNAKVAASRIEYFIKTGK